MVNIIKNWFSKTNKTDEQINLYQYKFLRFKKAREKLFPIKLSEISVTCQQGLVSIILPVFNCQRYISHAIDSVLTQTYRNFELIIIDDGSTDGTAKIIDEYSIKEKRITIIHQENSKIPRSLSRGFAIANGEFLTWTSADNILHKNFLEKMVYELGKNLDVAMMYANMRLIDEDGHILKKHGWYEKPFKSGIVSLPHDTLELNTYPNNTIGAAFLYRAVAAKVLGPYSEHQYLLEDYDYWMRMNSLFEIKHVSFNNAIYDYRWHKNSLTSQDKELGITSKRVKLMIFDDFRRDFYLTERMNCPVDELAEFKFKDQKSELNIADAKAKNDYLHKLEYIIALKKKYEYRISVVVCTKSDWEGLARVLESLGRQTAAGKLYELILVNNNFNNFDIKKTFDAFKMKYPNHNFRYILEKKEGLSFARNAALWCAGGEFILYIDDDAIADENLIEETIKCFEDNPNYGVIGGQIILRPPQIKPEVLTNETKVLWSHIAINGDKLIESVTYDAFPYGANFGVRTQALMEIGGFRTLYGRKGDNFAGGEEIAVCFMLKSLNMKIGLNPRSKVIHQISEDRYTFEHVTKTIISGIITQYRLRQDLYAPLDWSENYINERIRSAEKELNSSENSPLNYAIKKAQRDAFEMVLKEIQYDNKQRKKFDLPKSESNI